MAFNSLSTQDVSLTSGVSLGSEVDFGLWVDGGAGLRLEEHLNFGLSVRSARTTVDGAEIPDESRGGGPSFGGYVSLGFGQARTLRRSVPSQRPDRTGMVVYSWPQQRRAGGL